VSPLASQRLMCSNQNLRFSYRTPRAECRIADIFSSGGRLPAVGGAKKDGVRWTLTCWL